MAVAFSNMSFRSVFNVGPLYLFIASIGFAILLPIYTDEIGWRFQERAGFDGVDTMLSDLCGPQTIISPPAFMMPIRHMSALIASLFPDPVFIRLSGVIGAFVWLSLFLTFISRHFSDPETRLAIRNINLNYLTIGLLPFLFVMSRPEQPLNLTMISALLLLFEPQQKMQDGREAARNYISRIFRVFVCVALYAITLSYHPKAVLLAPFFFVIANLISRRSTWMLRVVINVVMLIAFFQAYNYWSIRFSCGGDPQLAADLATQNLMAMLPIANDIDEVLRAYLTSYSFVQYFTNLAVAPPEFTMSTWIFSDGVSSLTWTLSGLFITIIWILWIYAATIFFIFRYLKTREKPWTMILIVMTLVCPLVFMSVTQFVKNAYEITLIGPMILIGVTLLFSAYPPTAKERRYLETWNIVLTILSMTSVAANIYFYSGGLVAAADRSGYIPEQIRSQPVFNYQETRAEIEGAARQCRFEDDPSHHGLLVDDVTYLSFQKTTRPFHYLGVLSVWNGSIGDPIAYLRSRNSSGFIVGCHLLDDKTRAMSVRSGQFCCMNLDE